MAQFIFLTGLPWPVLLISLWYFICIIIYMPSWVPVFPSVCTWSCSTDRCPQIGPFWLLDILTRGTCKDLQGRSHFPFSTISSFLSLKAPPLVDSLFSLLLSFLPCAALLQTLTIGSCRQHSKHYKLFCLGEEVSGFPKLPCGSLQCHFPNFCSHICVICITL